MNSVREIERAIDGLTPGELAELHSWLGRHHPALNSPAEGAAKGLGLFGSPEDAALLDDVVRLAYEERRRPSRASSSL